MLNRHTVPRPADQDRGGVPESVYGGAHTGHHLVAGGGGLRLLAAGWAGILVAAQCFV